jgi:hypothetical protein
MSCTKDAIWPLDKKSYRCNRYSMRKSSAQRSHPMIKNVMRHTHNRTNWRNQEQNNFLLEAEPSEAEICVGIVQQSMLELLEPSG